MNNRYKKLDTSKTPQNVLDARAKLKARFGDKTKMGGKGSMRRKKYSHQQSHGNDDKKLKAGLRKFAVQPFPDIDEVNLFKDDGTVIHFKKPEALASMPNHIYCIMGSPETKSIYHNSLSSSQSLIDLTDLLPDVLNQLNKDQLKQLQEMQAKQPKTKPEKTTENDDEDNEDKDSDEDSSSDDIPDLEGDFEQTSKLD